MSQAHPVVWADGFHGQQRSRRFKDYVPTMIAPMAQSFWRVVFESCWDLWASMEHKKASLSHEKGGKAWKEEQKVSLALGMNLELRPCGSSSTGSVISVDLSGFEGLDKGWTRSLRSCLFCWALNRLCVVCISFLSTDPWTLICWSELLFVLPPVDR